MASELKTVKFHVGNLPRALVNDASDLNKRFGRHGTVLEPLQVHYKEICQYSYGYIRMELTTQQMQKLLRTFNGVNYKGAKLSVEVARPDFKEQSEIDRNRSDNKVRGRERRAFLARKRQERIELSHENPFKTAEVISGRMRKSVRKRNPKDATMRVEVGGKLVVAGGHKQKLWGYDKNKPLDGLSSEFKRGKWRDASGRTIEKVSKPEFELELDLASAPASAPIVTKDETDRIEGVLNSVLGNYNFDKPVDMEDDEEFDSGSDYELEHGEAKHSEPVVAASEDLAKKYREAHPDLAKRDIGYDEDDGSKIEGGESSMDDGDDQASNSDLDTEFVPTFGQSEKPSSEGQTEQLRSLLNPINQKPAVKQDVAVETVPTPVVAVKKDVGLFFAHFNSPFLEAQSQVNRLSDISVGDEYETWFYEQRGELFRECRYKRHDAQRHHKRGPVRL